MMHKGCMNTAANSKTKSCLDRIRVIRGVGIGQISEEQLTALFTLYGLTNEEENEVKKELEKKGQCLLPENLKQYYMIGKRRMEYSDFGFRKMLKETYLKQEYASYLKLLEKDKEFTTVHREKTLQLQKAIAEEFSKRRVRPAVAVRSAIQKISKDLPKRHKSEILVGKQRIWLSKSKQVNNFFRSWLKFLFTEEEMVCLALECVGGAKENSNNHRILMIMVSILLRGYYGFGKNNGDDKEMIMEDNYENRQA